MSENFGLNPLAFQIIQSLVQSELKDKSQYSIFVFGSRALGKHRQYSDLDLWIEANPSLSKSERTHLLEKLENSDLPIHVDIVTKETCLDDYRENISQEKKLWWEKK